MFYNLLTGETVSRCNDSCVSLEKCFLWFHTDIGSISIALRDEAMLEEFCSFLESVDKVQRKVMKRVSLHILSLESSDEGRHNFTIDTSNVHFVFNLNTVTIKGLAAFLRSERQ